MATEPQFSVDFNDQGGNNDPADGKGAQPSTKTAQRGQPAPPPYFLSNPTIPIIGSPIMGTPVVTDQLHLGNWKIYVKDKKMYASDGLHELQFVMVNPGGLEQKSKPNKVSDGSDGSGGQSSGNTAVSGRTVPPNTQGVNAGSTPVGSSLNVPSGSNVDSILRTLRQRESSNDYTRRSTTSSASGAYQFTSDTWRSVSAKAGYGGQYNSAAEAPPAVQDSVARWYVNDILRRANGDINAVPNEWYTGRTDGQMTQTQLAANNGLTSAQYRNNFFGTFNSINGSSGTPLGYASVDTPNNNSNFTTPASGIGAVSANYPSGNNVSNQGVNSIAGQVTPASLSQQNSTLSCVPCTPNEIADAMNKLTPGGLTGLVLDLTGVTQDLSKITKQIADLLPGIPFSITSEIIKQFTEGFSGLNDSLGAINKELTGGVTQIVNQLNCISQDLNAVSGGINKIIDAYSPDQFVKILPANLSIDDVIDSKANDALFNIKLEDTTKPRTTADGVPIFTQDQINRPVLVSTVAETVTEPTEEFVEPEVRVLLNLSESEIVEEQFVAKEFAAQSMVNELLGRVISEEEWSNLIAAVYAVCSEDSKERAWFVRTVINRSQKAGASLIDITKEFKQVEHRTQKFVLGPMNDSEVSINHAIISYINNVPHNNYYFDSFSPETMQYDVTYVAQRKGVPGIAIGQSFVYPGAKWP